MLHTSEQLANEQLMELHENVTQGVTDRQERHPARSSNDEYLTQ